ncbi:glucose dehydrogenase [FAD, quinone] isoform X1 [Fopius arisanus]|uniref:Glucose dehydrogenase [FAD, quinone] isoform X1 n=1 Tax=Fopius arisanus TaxID=64838 RepID=A0A9R1TT35_9HYME|nr:PREDICTED: glucose dehydrogenase [FAD, quinone]-like isoform X1 [Fopius arisanus]
MEELQGMTILSLLLVHPSMGASMFQLFSSYGFRESFDIPTVIIPTRAEYDFIIVGAGSGGSVITNRLSENRKWKILLLEAGKPEGILNQIPILVSNFQQTDYNWGYRVEEQKSACLGMKDRRCTWPRGKSLGGTSTLNYMIHTRGNRLDYDQWAALGNDGWSYEEVLPYFRKSERFRVPGPYNSSFHGEDGPLCVEHAPYHTKLASSFLKAGQHLGYEVLDCNGPQQIGFSYLQLNMDKGSRCSASRAYLRIKRSNLDIVTDARVTKILIDNENRVQGVKFVKNGVTQTVRARKEVVLSAGTIDSAKLLMLSGIGPKQHLEDLGITVLRDLPVGHNLYEHIGFLGLTFMVNQSLSFLQNRLVTPRYIMDYALHRSGPLSTPGGAEALAFIRTKYAIDSRPDVELLFNAGSLHSDNGVAVRKGYGVSDQVYNAVFKPIEGKDAFSIWPITQNPRSHGRIILKSKNPFDDPIIQPNFFQHPADIEIILEAIKHALRIVSTPPFEKYGARVHTIKIPGCESLQFDSDDYWRCAIRHLPSMMNHEIGTAKMGPSTDPSAVVDPRLRVHGVLGLRVIDASVMPTMPVGHINAGIFMIGEKGADMIKQDWEENQ